MNPIVFGAIIYIAYLLIWLFINLLTIAISIVTRKNFMIGLQGFTQIINFLLGLFLSLGGLYLYIYLLMQKQYILFVILLIVGSFLFSIITSVVSFLSFPFIAISTYFTIVTEKQLKEKNNEYEAEVISPDGKIIEKYASSAKLNSKLSFYFLTSYLLILFSAILTKQNAYEHWNGILDYIWNPLVSIFLWFPIVGLIVIIYNLIRKRRFLPLGFKSFSVTIFSILSYIMGGVIAFWFVRYVLF